MHIDIFWLHAFVLAVALVVAYNIHIRTLRLKARFNLYRVRDRFVLLLAHEESLLDEDNVVFVHYYGRINRLLQQEKPAGIDDLLQLFFHKFKDGEFQQILEQAKKQAAKIAAEPAANHQDVRSAIADYYAAMEMLILSHSSLLRAAWVISRHFAGAWLAKVAAPIAPDRIRRGWAAVDYAEQEAKIFQHA